MRYPKPTPKIFLIIVVSLTLFFIGVSVFIKNQTSTILKKQYSERNKNDMIISGTFDSTRFKTEEEWRTILTPKQYHILREAGTEIPFTGALNDKKMKGTYVSIGCNTPVFRSEHKYDSGTGWPSFWKPIDETAVVLRRESRAGDNRIEVLDRCGGHLGHVFDDGPQPTGKRYCINSESLRFIPDKK